MQLLQHLADQSPVFVPTFEAVWSTPAEMLTILVRGLMCSTTLDASVSILQALVRDHVRSPAFDDITTYLTLTLLLVHAILTVQDEAGQNTAALEFFSDLSHPRLT
eukprot:CAMPEP_0177679932 /NCGR_PEP_ID=MMETSP0447-20121125/29888_1 /TAXON_ID=0 /ORGANISM="Stygamoeba regulata, Strain BSH-02190019" /LENGTH=105 /DNA_ID=CAMNT_0019189199 /DNA_START=15 /DNA_END=329 /DNA_ORIENTATION=+